VCKIVDNERSEKKLFFYKRRGEKFKKKRGRRKRERDSWIFIRQGIKNIKRQIKKLMVYLGTATSLCMYDEILVLREI
jgi:hypothetical protein